MYERFTDRVREVMQLANWEAQRLAHDYIGTEHILLGLLKEGSGVAIQVLTSLTLDPRQIAAQIERLVQKGSTRDDACVNPSTPRAKNVIQYAMEEARNLKHGYVGTEHILLGLLREDMGVAGVVLANFGLRVEGTRREIEYVLRQPHDWGRKPPLPQFPEKWAAQTGESNDELPKACPKCGHAPVVRVIWRWVHLFGKNLEDVNAGRAILGSQFGAGGPSWVCLQCAPAWSEVQRLAMQDHELQIEKEKAIASQEFDKAAQCRDAQVELRRQLAVLFDVLAREE